MNETRNQLLHIEKLLKKDKNKDADRLLDYAFLLERFKIEIDRKIKDLEYEKQELENNRELVNYIIEKNNIKTMF